jgi:lysine biosynthesis protein LysW
MQTQKTTVELVCPDCYESFKIHTVPNLGEKITCPNCWAYLIVVSLDPVLLEWDEFDEEEDVDDE